MSDDYPPTPQCDKLNAVREKTQLFFEIIEWLEDETNLRLAVLNADEAYVVGIGRKVQLAVAKFFEIDLDEVEREKQRVLDWVHEQQKGG